MSVLAELLDAVGDRSETRRLAPGDVLCRHGEPGDTAFLIVAGTLEATGGAADARVVVGHHRPGSLIGEITAVAGGRRTATLVAVEPTEVVEIRGEALARWLDQHPAAAAEVLDRARQRMDRTRLIGVLSSVIGREAPAVELADQTSWIELRSGDRLFSAGDPTTALHVVLTGRLVDPDRAISWGRGDLLGEIGVLDGGAHLTTVHAARPTTVAAIDRRAVDRVIGTHPRTAAALVRHALADHRSGGHGRWITVAVVGDLDRRALTSPLVDAIGRHGSTRLVSAAGAEADLDRHGLAEAPVASPGGSRLAEYFHHLVADFDTVVAEASAVGSNWTDRCMGMADLVLIAVPAEPTPHDLAMAAALAAAATDDTVRWAVLVGRPTATRPTGTATLVDEMPWADEVHHLRITNPGDTGRLGRLASGHGQALVLSGGGARGFAHVGVVRALQENEIAIDRVGGASIGAVISGTVAEEIGWEEMVAVVEEHFHRLLDYTVPVVSLLKGKRITESIERRFGPYDIEDLRVPFFCTSTNLTRSRVEVHRRGSLATAIRASVAIPGVLPPVPHGQDLLVDGGVLNNLPVDLVRADPSVGSIIAVDVAPSIGPRARADFGLSVSGWEALRAQIGRGKPGYPGLAAVLTRSMLVGAARDRDRHLASGAVDLLFDLDLRGVGLLDFENVRPVVERGYEQAGVQLEAWRTGDQAPLTIGFG